MVPRNEDALGAGGYILGLAHICAASELVDDAELRAVVAGIEPDGWYPIDRLLVIQRLIMERFANHAPLLLHAGTEFMASWAADAIRRENLRSAADFLELQRGSRGYAEVIRGPAGAVGRFDLERLEVTGRGRIRAEVASSTPFEAEYERGILLGGVLAFPEVLYAGVEMARGPRRTKRFSLELRLAADAGEPARIRAAVLGTGGSPAGAAGFDPGDLAWAFRNEMERHAREREHLAAANAYLRDAAGKISRVAAGLRVQADVDPLTGLHNRRYAMRHLQAEWERAAQEGTALSLALIDLDHFKNINDRYGHPGGDSVLTRAAGVIRSLVREEDGLARLGGEEFILILPDTPAHGALAAAERIRRGLQEATLELGAFRVRITASVGVASRTAADTPERLIEAADEALYAAKAAGRNTVRCHDGSRRLTL